MLISSPQHIGLERSSSSRLNSAQCVMIKKRSTAKNSPHDGIAARPNGRVFIDKTTQHLQSSLECGFRRRASLVIRCRRTAHLDDWINSAFVVGLGSRLRCLCLCMAMVVSFRHVKSFFGHELDSS